MNVTLAGYMGSGKTTVGRLLAERLGWTFVDTDALIEARAGRSIPRLFAEEGEEGFRALEAQVIREVARGDRQVIATGGGAAVDPANRLALALAGPLVLLEASPETLWARVSGSDRPLASDPDAFLARYRARRPAYDRIPFRVSAKGRPERIADRIAWALQAEPRRLSVSLPDRSYPIAIAPHSLARLGPLMRERLAPGRCLLVSNPAIDALYGDLARASLEEAGWEPHTVLVPAGERHKRMASAMRLYDRALEARLERGNPVVALGGGVIGDLAGFVAATFNRGVPFVQVPTSLLAQIDSSVGGKVAVNHPKGKNLIGAFHQPSLVVADPLLLRTLPRRELRAGLAEMIKYGAILDPEFFAHLEATMPMLLERRMEVLLPAIARCCELKARVVCQDEREAGLRAILNYGHTLGHAVEAETSYRSFLHGEAVAIGMAAASAIGVDLGMIDAAAHRRLLTLLERAGLPTAIPGLSALRLMAAMAHDKKVQSGTLRWVLPEAIGRVRVCADVPAERVQAVLCRLGAS